MGLADVGVVDFAATETATGIEVLVIADSWDWSDERAHLAALQDKFNAYFAFVETGQLVEERPAAAGRPCRIELVSRFPFPDHLHPFLEAARTAAAELGLTVTQRHVPDA